MAWKKRAIEWVRGWSEQTESKKGEKRMHTILYVNVVVTTKEMERGREKIIIYNEDDEKLRT